MRETTLLPAPNGLKPNSFRRSCPIRPWTTVAAGLLFFLVLCVPAAGDEIGFLAEAESLLNEGKHEEALVVATKGLEYEPEDLALLEVASSAAHSSGKIDESLWYATIALEVDRQLQAEAEKGETVDPAQAERLKKIRARIEEIDPLLSSSTSLIDSYAGQLVGLADTCEKRKYYVNAVDLLTLCKGTGADAEAREKLDKIFAKKKAEQALINSGMDVPMRKKKLSKKKLRLLDARHKEWDNAEEIKSKNYTVVTNMGHEIGSSISAAMEQMNLFYRKVFQHKQRGGGTARCSIQVYKSRSEFDKYENYGDKPTVRGFFQSGRNRVCTYNPVTDGRSIARLWSTLFHEASHQFTNMVSADLIPGWLNEGTASYFEGARLLPSGLVRTNLIPDHRLRSLKIVLERGDPSLKEVLSYFSPGSYPGSYYPVGWGLVYFIHNFEDEKCERPYLRPYQLFLKSYKSGGKHDTFSRFEEYFIKKTKVAGIRSFEDFEKNFKDWIFALHSVHFGPASQADVLIEKARKQASFSKYEQALESYQRALEKRPGDTVASYERAEVLAKLKKRKDEALFCYRQALSGAQSLPDPDKPLAQLESQTPKSLAERCISQIQSLDRNVAKATAEAEAAFINSASKIAADYLKNGLPKRSLHLLGQANGMVRGHRVLIGREDAIRKDEAVETRRWRRLAFDQELEDWSGDSVWKHEDRDTVSVKADPTEFLTHVQPIDGDYRFELTLRVSEKDPQSVFGLSFGSNNFSGRKMLVIFGDGKATVGKLDDGLEILARLSALPPRMLKEVNLSVVVEGNQATFFVEDKELGSHEFPPGHLEGRVGVLAQGGVASFSNLRVLY